MIEKYYKRVKNGKTIELHLHKENEDETTTSIIYPKPEGSSWYEDKEFVELECLDEWLDEGLSSGIFTSLQQS